MGRTVPTYRGAVESMEESYRKFRRALDPEGREAFDSLMSHVREHSAAGGYAATLDPFESAALSMLLEHEMELKRLRRSMGVDE